MTDFQILTAIRNNGGSIGFTDLLNQGFLYPKPDGKVDKYRIENLLADHYISGDTSAHGTIRMEPKGTVLLEQIEQKLYQHEQDRADEMAKEKRERKFSVALTIFGELIAFALGFLTHLLIS